MTLLDWLWLGAAWAVGGGGVVLFVWAMVWDRSRGRRRCPTCWYDMKEAGALPATCPECGRETRRERRLHKTRRRWRWAAAGVLLVLVGLGGGFGRRVYRDGWVKATPTVVYIATLPWLDEKTTYAELTSRLYGGTLSRWEYEALVRRAVGLLTHSTNPDTMVRAAWVLNGIETGGRNIAKSRPWGTWVKASEIDCDGIMLGLERALRHENREVRFAALFAATALREESNRLALVMLGMLPTEDQQERTRIGQTFMFMRADEELRLGSPLRDGLQGSEQLSGELAELCSELGTCGLDVERGVPIFLDHLASVDEDVRRLCVWGLAMFGRGDPAVRDGVLQMTDDSDVSVRCAAVGAIGVFPLDERGELALDAALMDDDDRVRGIALSVAEVLGARGIRFRDRIGELMRAERLPWNREWAAHAFVALGGDRNEAVEAVFSPLRSDMRNYHSSAFIGDGLLRVVLAERADGVPEGSELRENLLAEVRDWAESLMHTEEHVTVVEAAHLYAALGGDPLRAIRTADAISRDDQDARNAFQSFRWLAENGTIEVSVPRILMESDDPRERAIGAWLAGGMRARAAPLLPRLRELAGDRDARTSYFASEAVDTVQHWVAWEERKK